MKRKTPFWVALLTAVITFGSLMAFVGLQNSGWNRNHYGWHHHHHDNYDRDYRYEHNSPTDTSRNY